MPTADAATAVLQGGGGNGASEAEVAEVVAAAISANKLDAYVMDPVMVATSGDRLLERYALWVLGLKHLF